MKKSKPSPKPVSDKELAFQALAEIRAIIAEMGWEIAFRHLDGRTVNLVLTNWQGSARTQLDVLAGILKATGGRISQIFTAPPHHNDFVVEGYKSLTINLAMVL